MRGGALDAGGSRIIGQGRRQLRLQGVRPGPPSPERPRPALRYVPWHVIAKRRARNRMAAKSRRRNRR